MSRSPEGLEVAGLRKRLGSFELAADFKVGAGERAGLVGRSGSGKSTLLRLLAGLERPEAGAIRLGGEELTALPAPRREIGLVFQDQALFPDLDVLGNVTFGLRMRGWSRADREREAEPWLARAGLEGLRKASVSRLSGGEAQRVALLRALVWKPRLLLLDEPFSALDRSLRESMRRLVGELHALWPVPLILVSHDPGDLEALTRVRLVFEEEPGSPARRTVVRT